MTFSDVTKIDNRICDNYNWLPEEIAREMEREHCQIEHRKSKSCPTARQIKFDSV